MDSSDGEYEDEYPGAELHVIPKRWQSIGLSENYAPDWNTSDAFREFIQNWVDAIKNTNDLGSSDFDIDIHDNKVCWLARALSPKTKALLGYIRYSKKKGSVELTNFNSQLDYKTINLGVTSKRYDMDMAGSHGEGYKVACLVFARQGYQVKFEASKRAWRWYLGGREKDTMGVCISKEKEETENQKSERLAVSRPENAKPRAAKANLHFDVSVHIGNLWGRAERRGCKVQETVFLDWIKVSLLLHHPDATHIINTTKGSLILDPRFEGKVYLKGLLLTETARSRMFKFGYNIAHAQINRDREMLKSFNEQNQLLAEIWQDAIEKDAARTLEKYVNMIRDDAKWGDVACAGVYISNKTAQSLWQFHLSEDPKRLNFYYNQEDGGNDIQLIRQRLKKTPMPLKKTLWEAFRRHKLVRTPQERMEHLLKNASDSNSLETRYSLGMKRALMAALALDPRTKYIKLVFKSEPSAALDILMEKSKAKSALLINDRYLEFFKGHSTVPCSFSEQVAKEDVSVHTFSCLHIITTLYEQIVIELTKCTHPDTDSGMRIKIDEKLRQMPQGVTVELGNEPGYLKVSWNDFESEKDMKLHSIDKKGCVVLHRERTCSHMKAALLTPENPDTVADVVSNAVGSFSVASCGCPQKLVSMKDSTTMFYGLSSMEKYFPMVGRLGSQNCYGTPPDAIQGPQEIPDTPDRPAIRVPTLSTPRDHVRNTMFGPPPTNGAISIDDDGSTDGSLFDHIDWDSDSPVVSTSVKSRQTVNSKQSLPSRSDSASSSSQTQEREEIKQLHQINSTQRTELQRKDDELKSAQFIAKTCRDQLQGLMDKFDKSKGEADQLRAELGVVNGKVHTMTEELQKAKANSDTRHQNLSHRVMDIHHLRRQVELLQQQLLEATKTVANKNLEKQMRDMNDATRLATIETLSTELNVTKKQLEELRERQKAREEIARLEYDMLKKRFERQTKELEGTKAALATSTRLAEDRSKTKEQQDSTVERLTRQNKEAINKLTESRGALDKANNDLALTERQLKDALTLVGSLTPAIRKRERGNEDGALRGSPSKRIKSEDDAERLVATNNEPIVID